MINNKLRMEFQANFCEIEESSLLELVNRAYDKSNKKIYPDDMWLFLEGIKVIFNNQKNKEYSKKLFQLILKEGKKSIAKYIIEEPIHY